MAQVMRTVMEADVSNFVSEMNKADKSITQSASTAKQTSMAIGGLSSSFDTLTGGAIPGLNSLTSTMRASKMMSASLLASWNVLKNMDFTRGAITGMRGVTTQTVAADGATKALTISTGAYMAVATLGIAAAVYGVTQLISHISSQREETERLREEERKLYDQRIEDQKSQQMQKGQTAFQSVMQAFAVPETDEERLARLEEEQETVRHTVRLRKDDLITTEQQIKKVRNLITMQGQWLSSSKQAAVFETVKEWEKEFGMSISEIQNQLQGVLSERQKAFAEASKNELEMNEQIEKHKVHTVEQAAKEEFEIRAKTEKEISDFQASMQRKLMSEDQRRITDLQQQLDKLTQHEQMMEQRLAEIQEVKIKSQIEIIDNAPEVEETGEEQRIAQFQKELISIRNAISEEIKTFQEMPAKEAQKTLHGILQQYQTAEERQMQQREEHLNKMQTLLEMGYATEEDMANLKQRIAGQDQKQLESKTKVYRDMLKTSNDKLQETLDQFEEVAGLFSAEEQEAIRQKIIASDTSLSQMAGGSLSAMARGSVEAYQTLRQTQDPNTKLLDQIYETMTIQNRTSSTIESYVRDMSGTLQMA